MNKRRSPNGNALFFQNSAATGGVRLFFAPPGAIALGPGFSAVPAGGCDGSSFLDAGFGAYFWSATQAAGYPRNAYYRDLDFNYAIVYRASAAKYTGKSVRCLRD